jgi:predicted transcriptional regulator
MATPIERSYEIAGDVLKHVSQFPPRRVGDIASNLGYDVSEVCISLGMLERNGLVSKVEDNGTKPEDFKYKFNRKRLEQISSLTLPAMKYLKMA